jgi:hypothetical protein
MSERDPAPSRVALAAITVWVAALTAVFVLLYAPWWVELAARKGFPALAELGKAVQALFFRDYLF